MALRDPGPSADYLPEIAVAYRIRLGGAVRVRVRDVLFSTIITFSAVQRRLATLPRSTLQSGVLCITKLTVMNNFICAVAAAQLLLISPAVLFMAALVVRNQPLPYESAHAAQRVVMWYAARQWTLWVLLIALPVTGLVTGCITLLRGWSNDVQLRQPLPRTLATIHAHRAMLFIAATTLTAGAILAVVAIHMAAN